MPANPITQNPRVTQTPHSSLKRLVKATGLVFDREGQKEIENFFIKELFEERS